MQPLSLEEVLDEIVEHDSRYQRDAYIFMREALEYTQRMVGKPKRNEVRHVTGGELLAGIRNYAIEQYGPMVPTLLSEWGIHSCEDFGEIVFIMVEHNLLAKTESDSRDDFKCGYDFDEAFSQPFLPSKKKSSSTPKSVGAK